MLNLVLERFFSLNFYNVGIRLPLFCANLSPEALTIMICYSGYLHVLHRSSGSVQ